MSKEVKASFFNEVDKERMCPPQHIPWSNPNEGEAGQWTSRARSRDYPHEPGMKLDEDKKEVASHKHKKKKRNPSMESSGVRNIPDKDNVEEKAKVKGANPTGKVTY